MLKETRIIQVRTTFRIRAVGQEKLEFPEACAGDGRGEAPNHSGLDEEFGILGQVADGGRVGVPCQALGPKLGSS